jgi:transposase
MQSSKANINPYSRENLLTLDHDTLVDIVISFDARFQQLADRARDLINEKYGRKSERFESPGQLLLFPENAGEPSADAVKTPSADESELGAKKPAKEKKPGHARNPIPPDLPKIPVFAPVPDEDKLPCQCCGTNRVPVRHVLQHSRYGFIPASFYNEELYSIIYGCPNTNCPSEEKLVAEVPEAVQNGMASPGLHAQVAVSRDFDHMPFNRQSEIYKRSGVNLSRSTLSDMYAQVAAILLPLYTLMHQILLQSKIISTDDTPVKVLDRSKDKNIKRGYKWAFLGDEDHPVNLFHYTHSRGRDGPLVFLKEWKGRLQGDCFSGNRAICAAIGTILVACIAHARRYFIKALLNNKDGCNQALTMFQKLYEIEGTARDLELSCADLKLMREQEAVPYLESFHKWLQKQYSLAPPKSSFGKALFYCLNNWNELTQYVSDGALKIDNNHTEREMKYIAMGRHAWLFFGSDKGAKDHAIVFSVLSTCRRHGVEPWSYLTDVIRRLTENPNCDLEELLPYNWKQKYPIKQTAEITVVSPAPKLRCA